MKALVLGLAIASTHAIAQTPTGSRTSLGGGNCSANVYNCPDTPNPLPAPNTVWLEEMTWMDVRDAMAAGKTTIIIPTGGIEPNGPWLALGKHNYVLRANCDAIARALGNALCAPIVPFVPEGRIEPQSGHMQTMGTISMREETYRALLTDIVHSLKAHGFRNIILIGDSGGNQPGQRAVADSLTALWKGEPVVAHVQEYYDYAGTLKHMASRGLGGGKSDGLHDDPVISLNMYATDPQSIRWQERVKAGKATIDGVSLADSAKNRAYVRGIIAFRTSTTVDAIRKAIANKGTLPAPPRPAPASAGIFAEGVISDANEQWRITFTPDGRTAYFASSTGFFPATRQATIYESRLVNGTWTTPTVAPFSGVYSDIDPFIAPNGQRLYFSSIRPVDGVTRKDIDLWMVERTPTGWGEPIHLGPEVNTAEDELYPSATASGTLYFASGPLAPQAGKHWDIYSAERAGDGFAPRVRLGAGVNTEPSPSLTGLQDAWEFNPEITADGNTLLFTSLRPGGHGFGDIYVSHLVNGEWTAARNLGPLVNTAADEFHPTLSRDRGELYFVRRIPDRGNFYHIPTSGLDLR